jgi:hypothetical protein
MLSNVILSLIKSNLRRYLLFMKSTSILNIKKIRVLTFYSRYVQNIMNCQNTL